MSSSVPVSLDDTYGCLFVACILTTALWGAATVQLYLYYNKYAGSDTWRMKSYVALVWALDTALQIVDIHSTYRLFVTNFDNLLNLFEYDVESDLPTMLTLIVDALVQFFFLYRIWRFSRGNILVVAVGLTLILAQAGLLLAYFGKAYHFTLITELESLISVEHAINAVTAATDIYLAGVLVIYLMSARSRSRVSIEEGNVAGKRKTRTESVVERMIYYTLGTGSLTALCAVIALITELAKPGSFAYVLLDLLIPNVYLNSMLVALNSRQGFLSELDTPSGTEETPTSASTPHHISTFHAAARTDLSTLSTREISTVLTSGTEHEKSAKHVPADSHSDLEGETGIAA